MNTIEWFLIGNVYYLEISNFLSHIHKGMQFNFFFSFLVYTTETERTKNTNIIINF